MFLHGLYALLNLYRLIVQLPVLSSIQTIYQLNFQLEQCFDQKLIALANIRFIERILLTFYT